MIEDQTTKSLIRSVVRQIHPDLFTAHPLERSRNSESLKALNVYADQISRGEIPEPAYLEFYIRNEQDSFTTVTARLLTNGSLGPLFLAFGLITPEEAAEFYGSDSDIHPDNSRDLFEWLSNVAAEAALASDQHDALKRSIRDAIARLEDDYGFSRIDIGGQFSLNSDAQEQQLQSLQTLQSALQSLQNSQDSDIDVLTAFVGLPVRIYHPDAAPMSTIGFLDSTGTFNMKSEPMTTHVSDNGTLHIIADPSTLESSLQSLHLDRANLLAKVNTYWSRRSRDLSRALKSALAVENVWFDARAEHAAQKFVLWVGTVLRRADDIETALRGRTFAFSVLVHSDGESPLLEFVASSSVLQVRTDCPPKHLLAFMASEAGILAHKTAALVADGRAEEEEALAAVRDALGAKHVVRVCSEYDQSKVLEAAQRLVEAAPSLRASLDLSGVSLAIDDCYEVWDSGFVSIPFDFQLTDLQPQLKALLMAAPVNSGDGVGDVNGNAAYDRDGIAVSALPSVNRMKSYYHRHRGNGLGNGIGSNDWMAKSLISMPPSVYGKKYRRSACRRSMNGIAARMATIGLMRRTSVMY